MSDYYAFIYLLKPGHEIEPDWRKLRWRPILHHTWSLYCRRNHESIFTRGGLSVRWWRDDALNGWGRYFKKLHFQFELLCFRIGGWVLWNISVHKDGPSDASPQIPLVLP